MDTIGEKDCLILKNQKDMEYIRKVSPLWYGTLEETDVQSVLMFPLRHECKILGFMWVINFDTQNTVPIKETLELTAFFISSQLSSYKDVISEGVEHLQQLETLHSIGCEFILGFI